jgi:hypothetical protein
MQNDYVSREAAAARAGVSLRTLERAFTNGNGPVRQYIGRRAFYSIAAIDAWLATQGQPQVGQPARQP